MYVSEAHAQDEWRLYSDVCFNQPTSSRSASKLRRPMRHASMKDIPLVVDLMDNAAEHRFAAWPERLWCVGPDGRIGFKGDLGPDGCLPEKVREYLQGLQLGSGA